MKPVLVGIRIKNKSEVLPLCLQALAFQTFKGFDVFIFDESDVPVTDYYPVRLCMDLLQVHCKIDIHHMRRIESKNVAWALQRLIDYSLDNSYKYLLMLDADMIMTCNCLNKLYKTLRNRDNTIYTEPTVLDITNVLGHKDYTVYGHLKEDLKNFSTWGLNHQKFLDDMEIKRTVTTASIPLIDLNKVQELNIVDDIRGDLLSLGNLPGEDIVMFYHLTKGKYKGLLVTSALAYHFSHTESKRDWYNVTRQLQEKITNGELI